MLLLLIINIINANNAILIIKVIIFPELEKRSFILAKIKRIIGIENIEPKMILEEYDL